jgi:hypothetical protein
MATLGISPAMGLAADVGMGVGTVAVVLGKSIGSGFGPDGVVCTVGLGVLTLGASARSSPPVLAAISKRISKAPMKNGKVTKGFIGRSGVFA